MKKRSKKLWAAPEGRNPSYYVAIYEKKPKQLDDDFDDFNWKGRVLDDFCPFHFRRIFGKPSASWSTDTPEPVAFRIVMEDK